MVKLVSRGSVKPKFLDRGQVPEPNNWLLIGDIADVIGCSSGAVSKRIRKLDPTGEIIYNIRSKKQPHKDRVINILNNKPLYKVLDVDIIKEYNKTNNYEAVGRKYGVTGAAVKRRLKQIK